MKELLKHLTLVDFIVETDEEIKKGDYLLKHNKSKGVVYTITKSNGYRYHSVSCRKRYRYEEIFHFWCSGFGGSVDKIDINEVPKIVSKKYHKYLLKKFGKSIEDFKEEKRKWETLSID